MEYRIRLAKEADAKAVHDIYGAYVLLDYVTFTVENPDIESYRRKIIATLEIIRCRMRRTAAQGAKFCGIP